MMKKLSSFQTERVKSTVAKEMRKREKARAFG
jgi:hypothetical protein